MIKYKIALINVFWSEFDQNTRYFENKNEQNNYFDTKASGHTSPLVNFKMGDNITTTVIYKDTTTRRVEEVVKSNYAVVYTVEVNEETKQETILNRRYFFAYCRQDSGRQLIVDLSLDDIQTNYFGYLSYYDKALIRRACLNRFRYLGEDYGVHMFAFNNANNSPLFEPEPIDEPPKRLVSRTSLNFEIDTASGSYINRFFKENIIGWEYVYLTPMNTSQVGVNWKVKDVTDGTTDKELFLDPLETYPYEYDHTVTFGDNYTEGNKIKGALICLCAPVYKHNSLAGEFDVLTSGETNAGIPNNQITISTKGIDMFLEMNGNNSYVYSRKFSIRPPFYRHQLTDSMWYDNTSLKNSICARGSNQSTTGVVQTNVWRTVDDARNQFYAICSGTLQASSIATPIMQGCFVMVGDIPNPNVTEVYDIQNRDVVFPLQELIRDQPRQIDFNPKLSSKQFFEIDINLFSQRYSYDFLKMRTGSFYLSYNEALTPDLTKGYARLNRAYGLYIDKTTENLTGLVISNDQSLMVANDKLSEVLANNKNFFLQQGLQIGMDAFGKATQGYIPSAVASVGLNTLNTYMFEYDNMRYAPSQVKNANGNVYFAGQIQPFKLAIEEYDILDQDKEKINDFMYLYGFSYNRVDTISNFTNIRRYFSYLEAELMTNTAPISNAEKDRLKSKFSGGIRFWNSDTIDYTKENYELELLNYVEGE